MSTGCWQNDDFLSRNTKEEKKMQLATAAQPKPEKSKEKAPKESRSFMLNLFRGVVEPSQVFPYPDVLTPEQTDTLNMLIDPVSKFFEVS
ncbi:hypothetical protein GE061_010523 [Apolygus lucorum]|uniref:Uncharacterized protein n=1 Tax=Apolygus lucorum TaxID=248454 RepID=A0A8S9XW47_APOLU|nr:hypothetical protein GE061_010523 [Apolygus lucorum]